MNAIDYAVLLSTMVGIAAYGIWKTRHLNDLSSYLRGSGRGRWMGIAARALIAARSAQAWAEAIRTQTRSSLHRQSPTLATNDTDYVFITFVLDQLPHGLIGLLLAVFFAAALQSNAAELNALAATTTIDLYRHVFRSGHDDSHHYLASKWWTAFWGLVAMSFALFASMSENLIQAVNIVGSIFYGVVLGLVLIAFFTKSVRGTAAFWGALAAQRSSSFCFLC